MSEGPEKSAAEPLFNQAADYYAWRERYGEAIFAKVAKALRFTGETALLDMCCGDGQVATGFAAHAGRITAFDVSPRMLERAPQRDNVTYRLHDVNQAPFVTDEPVQFVSLGRSLHWVEQGKLGETLKASLAPEGKVLIMGASWARGEHNIWLGAYRRLRSRYNSGAGKPDFQGVEKLAGLGFAPIGQIGAAHELGFDLDYLFKNTLSYGSSFQRVYEDRVDFRSELEKVMAPYLVGGRLKGVVQSWALVYGRPMAYSGAGITISASFSKPFSNKGSRQDR